MSRCFAVVHEADADFQTATQLADRVLTESIAWLDKDQLASQRTWVAEADPGRRFTWKGIKRLAQDAGIRVHGHFDGEPGLADAAAARRAIHYLRVTLPQLIALVLIRDQDDQPERLRGLEQARQEQHSGLPIVIGMAIVNRECWVLSGFDPENSSEASGVEAVRQLLGFNPQTHSHRLSSSDKSPGSSKRVLRELSRDDHDRERRCWCTTALTVLTERGRENGLAAYLGEVRDRLAPLIGSPPQEGKPR